MFPLVVCCSIVGQLLHEDISDLHSQDDALKVQTSNVFNSLSAGCGVYGEGGASCQAGQGGGGEDGVSAVVCVLVCGVCGVCVCVCVCMCVCMYV